MHSTIDQFLTYAEARLRKMAADQEEFRRSVARMTAHLAGASRVDADAGTTEMYRQLPTKKED